MLQLYIGLEFKLLFQNLLKEKLFYYIHLFVLLLMLILMGIKWLFMFHFLQLLGPKLLIYF